MSELIFPKPDRTTLLVVDIQERLLPAMGDERAAELVKRVRAMVELAAELDWSIIYSEQYPKGLGPTEASLKERLDALGASRLEKMEFSCCRAPGFDESIQPAIEPHVVVVGMETHICVLQTVADLQARGYQVFVPHDGVLSRTAANHQNGLELIERVGALKTNVESILFFELQRAGDDRFKRLSGLIR